MLVENMKTVLASSYVFGLKAQQFHWNVIGPDFHQLHEVFGNIYEEVFEHTDATAEVIRTMGVFAPGSLTEFVEQSLIEDEETQPESAMDMVARLADDNEIMIEILKTAYESAELSQEYDVSDFIVGRLAAHKKHGWMLYSILGRQRPA